MVKIVVVCHGQLAQGLVDAMSMIAGIQKDVVAVSLGEEDSIDSLEAQVEALVLEKQPGEGVLILTDLFGASPFNVSARIASRNEQVDVITGINLPILLEVALQHENAGLDELVQIAREAGAGSIKILSDLMKEP